MSDLKPCPCCGHRAELRDTRYDQWLVWSITCLRCGLMIDGGDKQAVIERWQRRRTDGMIAWLDAEIEKRKESLWFNIRTQAAALRQCKRQLLKLLDGMGSTGVNNERDIIMNTQPYAEDLGICDSEGKTPMSAPVDRVVVPVPNCIADAPKDAIDAAKEIARASLNTIRNIIAEEFPATDPETQKDFVKAICHFMAESE